MLATTPAFLAREKYLPTQCQRRQRLATWLWRLRESDGVQQLPRLSPGGLRVRCSCSLLRHRCLGYVQLMNKVHVRLPTWGLFRISGTHEAPFLVNTQFHGRLERSLRYLTPTPIQTEPPYFTPPPGPQHTWAHHHPVKTCIVENAFRHVVDPGTTLVDSTECEHIGKSMELETEPNKQYYPLDNILFHVQIPFLNDQIMSRKFHFVIADLAIHFNNDFLKIVVGM